NKKPLEGSYKNYTVLSAPLPQTGVYIIQALNILELFNLKKIGLPTVSAEAFDILTSTMRLANADRREYVSDPNWVDIPVDGMISEKYAEKRRKMAGTGSAADTVAPGIPASSKEAVPAGSSLNGTVSSRPLMAEYKKTGTGGETTHISVIDPNGNAVSLSTTLSHVFGSGAWVHGSTLNNSVFDFYHMEEEGDWQSSHPYRIRSSTISPTIILDENNEVRLVIGAPGGGRSPTAILQNTVYILDYGLDPLDAVKMPRIFPNHSN